MSKLYADAGYHWPEYEGQWWDGDELTISYNRRYRKTGGDLVRWTASPRGYEVDDVAEAHSQQALAAALREYAAAVLEIAAEVEALVPDIPPVKESPFHNDLLSDAIVAEVRPSTALRPFTRFKKEEA